MALSVVCFKWRAPPTYRSQFEAEHVNVLMRMVRRHYLKPHRFICVTDDPKGLHSGIEVVPLWNDFGDLPNLRGAHMPSCYRRLKLFSREAEALFGKRFVSLDLDTVIVSELEPLWDRQEDFIIWGDTHPTTWYNGSMFMMTAGARAQVWEEFDPVHSPIEALNGGHLGSDQAWISHKLGLGEATWSTEDGAYSYRVHVARLQGELPHNARIIFWHGRVDPWSEEAQQLPWVREHWR